MSNKKKTSLEFYRTELMALVSCGKTDYKTEPEIYEQAQELHRQEIMGAYRFPNTLSDISSEQYYRDTYETDD